MRWGFLYIATNTRLSHTYERKTNKISQNFTTALGLLLVKEKNLEKS